MQTTKLILGVFAVILCTFGVISVRVSTTSTAAARLVAQPQTSNVLIADGGDPVPRPWHKSAA
jgi:hypothetical protein